MRDCFVCHFRRNLSPPRGPWKISHIIFLSFRSSRLPSTKLEARRKYGYSEERLNEPEKIKVDYLDWTEQQKFNLKLRTLDWLTVPLLLDVEYKDRAKSYLLELPDILAPDTCGNRGFL